MPEQPLTGYRVFVDVLLDVTAIRHGDRNISNPAERAAIQFLDVMGAAGLNICGALHVSPLTRHVNPQTGELTWKMTAAPTRYDPK